MQIMNLMCKASMLTTVHGILKCGVARSAQTSFQKTQFLFLIFFFLSSIILVIRCGDPGNVVNAVRTGTNFGFGGTVQYVCNRCYTGGGTITCQANQRWTARPECTSKYHSVSYLLYLHPGGLADDPRFPIGQCSQDLPLQMGNVPCTQRIGMSLQINDRCSSLTIPPPNSRSWYVGHYIFIRIKIFNAIFSSRQT